jgi:signal transduction histidine kinase
MSLRLKTLLIVTLVWLFLMAGYFVFAYFTVIRSYQKVELEGVHQDEKFVVEADAARPGGAGVDVPGIRISVEDTGIGIAAENLDRIFTPFEQVESASSRKYHGTGLGLSLAKRMVELHAGTIWAESEGLGQGSALRFVIPLVPPGS